MSEDVIVLSNKQLVRESDTIDLCLRSVTQGKTKFGNEVLFMEFETRPGAKFKSSYPLDKGPEGKLAHFMRTARVALGLSLDEDIDVAKLIDKWMRYRRIYSQFESNGHSVKFYYFVLAKGEAK